MTDPRQGDVGAVGPAGSSSGTPGAGAGSSGRAGRTYVPAPEPEEADPPARRDESTGVTRTLPRADELTTRRPAPGPRTPLTPPPSLSPVQPVPPPGSAAGSRPRKGVRRARLRLTRIDPWSALKVSLVFAAFLFVVWMVAVLVLFAILQGAGVFDSVNSTLTDVFGAHIDFSGAVILGGAAVIGALSVVILTALGTVAAFAYNATAALLGGLDVTLTEQE